MTTPVDTIDQVMAVMAAAFDPAYNEAWNRRQVEDAMLMGNCHLLLIDADGGDPGGQDCDGGIAAAGFAFSRTTYDEEELLLFAVSPQYRRCGLGAAMLDRLAAAARARGARRLFLEMRRGNPAESLYRTFGFVPIGMRPNYYRFSSGDRVDALTFAIDL